MNIGVMGGTFDPIHSGHLIIAEEARQRLGLIRIIFVPAGKPWLKAEREITPATHRVKMIEQAIAANHHFELSTAEVERPGPSYTVDTLAMLQQKLGPNARLFFLLGWDSLADLPRWREPYRLVTMCHLVAFTRTGIDRPDPEVLETSVPGVAGSVIFMDITPIDISSSNIRERVAKRLSIHQLVPDDVEKYIIEQKLYQRIEAK
jgi:nicotinate-nucleotide adenylyltransferase